MTSWSELVEGLGERFDIVDQAESAVSVAMGWDDGRVQRVNLELIEFAGESVALVSSPIVAYSREAADFLLNNIGMALRKTDSDGALAVSHPLHLDHMPLESCIRAVSAIAESADEIEKSVTGGADAHIHQSTDGAPDQEHLEQDSAVITAGQYVVGTDIAPGLYRFAGYVARLDAEMQIIVNDSVRSGLGLVLVSPHDAYFEVSGEAIRLEDYPTYDVLGQAPRGGIYLVGTDIPPGRYRIHGEGRSAYYRTFDRNMNRLNSDLNRGNIIMNLQPSVFAVEFNGRLEQL